VQGKHACYECDSRRHPECGKTFGYNEQQAQVNGLIKRCKDDQLCRKTEVNVYGDHGKFVVRECFNSTVTGCREFLKDESEVCDCKGHLCNGQNMVKVYSGLIIAIFTLQHIIRL